MKKNLYEEYLKKQKIKEKYDEEVNILSKIFNVLFYLGIIILCSIGATYIANKIGIIKIF